MRGDRPPQRPPQRRSARIPGETRDVYGLRGKLSEPTVCTSCGASYRDGRWVWKSAPPGAQAVQCPACRRIRDHYPAGLVTVRGAFARAHRAELEQRVRKLEAREKAEHALKRIFGIEATPEGALQIATTSGLLARQIGEALQDAYQGELEQSPPSSEGLVRVHWTRE